MVLRSATRLPPAMALFISLLLMQQAHADVLALWDFQDVVAASSVAGNLSAGDVTLSAGTLLFINGADDGGTKIGSASSWQGEFAESGKHIAFSISPANGYEIQITNVIIRLGRSATGPPSFTAQYSLDGFATDGTPAGTAMIASEDAGALDSFALSVPADFQAGTVTYRVWGHNASSSSGTMRFNNFRVYGRVRSQLPAPILGAASVTNVTGFTATWAEVVDATGYALDVSSSSTFTAVGGLLLESGFDTDYPPAGWTENATEQTNTYNRSGAYSARLSATTDYLITPLITAASTLDFWSYTTSADPGVVVEHAAAIAGPWIAFPESPFSGNTEQWSERSIDMEGLEGVYVRFTKTGTGNLYVEDVVVTEPDVPSYVSGYQCRVIDGGVTTSAVVTGLVSSTAYFYRLQATNDTSTSASSTIQSVTTLVMPAPVVQVGSNIGGDRFNANWSTVPQADGYLLEVSTNHAFSDFLSGYQNRDVGSVIAHTVTGLVVETDYYYRVRAYDAGSTSGDSATQQVHTVFKGEPSSHATGFGDALTTHRTIVLEWTDAVDGELPDGYIVRGSTNGYTDIPVPADGSSVGNLSTWNPRYAHRVEYGEQRDEVSGQDSHGLIPGHTYYFKLFPVANSGTNSLYKTDGQVPQLSVKTLDDVPFEDFERGDGIGSKTSYSNAVEVTFLSGVWLLDEDVLIGSLDADHKRDQRALRIRNHGVAAMNVDVTNVETVLLEHANFSSDAGGRFVVERSVDGGSTWQQLGDEVVCGDALQTAGFTVHRLAGFRLRIRKTADAGDESRINIDNIRFTPFDSEPSVFRFR